MDLSGLWRSSRVSCLWAAMSDDDGTGGVYRWDGANWDVVPGLDRNVYALAVHEKVPLIAQQPLDPDTQVVAVMRWDGVSMAPAQHKFRLHRKDVVFICGQAHRERRLLSDRIAGVALHRSVRPGVANPDRSHIDCANAVRARPGGGDPVQISAEIAPTAGHVTVPPHAAAHAQTPNWKECWTGKPRWHAAQSNGIAVVRAN